MLVSVAGMSLSPQELPDAAFYEHHFTRLFLIATTELHMAEDEAIALVQDLLLISIYRPATISNLESWLTGALRAAASRGNEVRA